MAKISRRIIKAIKIASKESYYPELERKNYLRRLCDNLFYVIQNHDANEFYNAYGEDITGRGDG